MKKIYLLAAMLLLATACSKFEDDPEIVICPSFICTFQSIEFSLSEEDGIDRQVDVRINLTVKNLTNDILSGSHGSYQDIYESSQFIFDDNPDYVESVFRMLPDENEILIDCPIDISGNQIITDNRKISLGPTGVESLLYPREEGIWVPYTLEPYTQSAFTETIYYKTFTLSFSAVFFDVDSKQEIILTGKWQGKRVENTTAESVVSAIEE